MNKFFLIKKNTILLFQKAVLLFFIVSKSVNKYKTGYKMKSF